MTSTTIIILVLAAFIAATTQRVTGFGFGMLFMTVSPYLMPSYPEATALSGLLALFCAIIPGVRHFKLIPWRKLLPILITFLAVSVFSVKAAGEVDGTVIKKVLGGILIFLSFYFGFIKKHIHLKPTIPVQIGMGTLSGITGGLFAMQGPPAVIYFISCTDDKEEYMAITQWFFIISNSFMACTRAANGYITPVVLKGLALGVAAVLLGLFVGSRIYKKVPIDTIRSIVYVFIGVAGVISFVIS